MCTYLKPYNGIYYFRRTVPDDVRHLFLTATGKPRTEWRCSLRVKDREAAKRLIPPHVTNTNALIDWARQVSLSPAVELRAQQKAAHAPSSVIDELDRATLDAATAQHLHDLELEMRAETDPTFALDLELRAAKARELSALKEREQNRELATELRAEGVARAALPLTTLFDRFAAIPGRSPKTMAQWRTYLVKLAAFLGSDDTHAVTRKSLIEWRVHLRDVQRYKGKPLSPKTINDSYLGAVSALFAWAVGDGIVDANPMDGVTKISALRPPQTRTKELATNEALTILRASLVTATGREGVDWRNAKQWCPWLLAYTGARVNELTQLRKEDVIDVEGVPVIRLTPDAGTIKSKKLRLVPLHPHLIELGFVEFVAGRPEGPLFYSPSLRRSNGAINRQPNRLGSKLAEWVRSLGIVDVKPNHGWRHLFNTLAVKHGMDHRATMAILGHSSGNVNQQYGSVPVEVLARELAKLPTFQVDE